jgi:5-methylthioadenosine/S-adenosylhomocysteine deaminase
LVDILIKKGIIYTMDKQRRIIRDGAVAIDDGRIVDVGPTEELNRRHSADEVIDASEKAVLPGFVDVHTHMAENFLRGVYGVVPKGLYTVLFPVMNFMKPRHIRDFGLVACCEALRAGVTTVTESLNHMDAFAQVVEQTGIRANVAEEISDFDYEKVKDDQYVQLPEQGEEMYERAVRVADAWHGKAGGRVNVWFHALAPDMCTPELYKRVHEEASARGVKMTTHLAQSRSEIEQVKKLYGTTPVEHLHSLGILGENLLAAHCVYATDQDMKLIRETGTRVLHCPRSLLLRGSTVPLARWLQENIHVGLGTDDVFHSMWEVMRTALYAAQVRATGGDSARIPTFYELLELATARGAKVLGMEREIGSIQPGKKGDLQLVSLRDAHLRPTVDLTSSLVLYGSTVSVDSVIVDGRFVMKAGTMTTIDTDEVLARAQTLCDEIWNELFTEYPELEEQVRLTHTTGLDTGESTRVASNGFDPTKRMYEAGSPR